MNYALGHAFNLKHLFEKFNLKRLKLTCKDCLEHTGYNRHRDALAKQIFKDSVKLVLNDIIDNNVTFIFPNSLAKIHMQKTEGDDFVHARQCGKWQDVDFIASFYTGYELALTLKDTRVKPIYVGKEMKDRITKYTNEGKQYY